MKELFGEDSGEVPTQFKKIESRLQRDKKDFLELQGLFEGFQTSAEEKINTAAQQTNNLTERITDAESFIKESDSAVDKQARSIFDELMAPQL